MYYLDICRFLCYLPNYFIFRIKEAMRFLLIFLLAFLCDSTDGSGRKRTLVGGRVEADLSDGNMKKIIREYSWKGAQEVNKMSNSYHHFIPIRVVKMDTQVVSGVAYHMQIIYGQSECTKNQASCFAKVELL